MTRPWYTIALFTIGTAVILAAMAYVTANVLRLDKQQTIAKQRAVLEESVRLALWRIDAALSPTIAIENARPTYQYQPFFTAPHAADSNHQPLPSGQVLLPSPLLTDPPNLTRLHFQFDPNGRLSSPQNPSNDQIYLAFRYGANVATINNAFDRLKQIKQLADPVELAALTANRERPANETTNHITLSGKHSELHDNNTHRKQSGQTSATDTDTPDKPAVAQAPQIDQDDTQSEQSTSYFQSYRSTQELTARTEQLKNTGRPWRKTSSYSKPHSQTEVTRDIATATTTVSVSDTTPDFQPVWLNQQLLLIRSVHIDDRRYHQGVWLDWPAIEQTLQQTVADLFPNARFQPIFPNTSPDNPTRQLATLPIELIPGLPATPLPATQSPLHLPLIIAWVFALLAVAAIAAVLWGALALSERKSTFVSAVTHELRTPLTTFQLYTDLLASDKLIDPDKKHGYVQTLRVEAERLTHLVENVLAFARLERTSKRTDPHHTPITAKALIARSSDRLIRRAQQAGLSLDLKHDAASPDITVRTDPTAVEQILYNLVDNACKYAASDHTQPITISTKAQPASNTLAIHVQDYGPGIPPHEAKRLFRPFSRSARDAAGSAPGVGLGLALARRMARRLSGDLTLHSQNQKTQSSRSPGAKFTLTLPLQ